MGQTLCVFGRLPALSLAELESLYGADKVRPVGIYGALLDLEQAKVDFSRLGGTVKFCKVLSVLDTTNWKQIEAFLKTAVPQHVGSLPEGKMKLGLSLYGFKTSVAQINATALELKKIIKTSGKSVRVVPNKEPALSSAQVLHNQLTSALGWELIFIKNAGKTILAQNIAEQDIASYAARDQARPKRDAKVGMLPPKLAQTIVNLAVGSITGEPVNQSCEPGRQPAKGKTVLDPFCGTGVVLQEAALMGYNVYGTDIDQRMVDYAKTNLDWLGENFAHAPFTYYLDQADATSYAWDNHIDFIASEAYLGRPFSAMPSQEVLAQVMNDVNLIIKKFLQNLARQTTAGFRLCVAVPAWKVEPNFKHLPVIDQISTLGYNHVSFKHVRRDDLIYFREGQVVARELLVLTRK
jgi:SAM-dependent methyltransferase